MAGELVNVRFLEFMIPNDWLILSTDAVRSVSKLRALVAAFAVRPENAVPSSPLTGLFPGPNVANGVKPGSPNPLDMVFRNSKPPLKACFPCVQLMSSPMICIGLTCERHRPNLPYVMNPVHSNGTGWNGTPLENGTNLSASWPSASPRFAGGNCWSTERLRPARSSFSTVGLKVDVNVRIYTSGRFMATPSKPF